MRVKNYIYRQLHHNENCMTCYFSRLPKLALVAFAMYALLCGAFGVTSPATLGVTVYLLVFVGLAAMLLYRWGLLGEGWPAMVFATVLAHAMETVSYVVLLRLEATEFFYGYPLIWLGLGVGLRHRFVQRWHWVPVTRMRVVLLLGMAAIITGAMLPDFHIGEHHAQWLLSYTNALAIGMPPQDPFFAGHPLLYHYFFNAHGLAAEHMTGLPLYPILRFQLPAWELGLMMLAIVAAATCWYRHAWLGWLIVVQFLAYYHYSELHYKNL